MPKEKPEILNKRLLSPQEVADRGFQIEEMHLQFSNGERRYYRRIRSRGFRVALIVPMLDAETVLLIREYAAGEHDYQLQLPKGRVEPGESVLEAADREMKEEIGKGSNNLQIVNKLTVLPGFMAQNTDIVLAENLYDERLPGDEPEELEVVPWAMSDLFELAQHPECTEARSIAALYYVRDFLKARQNIAHEPQ